MMIWFAGILLITIKILVVITPIKIKQTKNNELWALCLLTHLSAHWLTLCSASVCSTVNTKITNFSISGTSTSKIVYFFHFLDSTSNFFLTVNGTFLGAPFQGRKTFFLLYWYYFLDAFLKKRMAPSTLLEVGSEELNGENRHLYQDYCNWVVRN